MTLLNKRLCLLAALTCLLCCISFLPSVSQKSAPKSFQSALLNPSHKNEVSEIIIESGGQMLTLAHQAFGWTVSDGECLLPAENRLVDGLLNSAIKIRKMYTILDSSRANQPSFFTVHFRDDVNLYTIVDFYAVHSLTNRISFAVEGKNKRYETNDDFSQYLQTTVSYWARSALIQLISEPIAFVFQEKGQKIRRIDENSADFSKKLHDLTVLRHGLVLSPENSAQADFAGFSARLTVSDGQGNTEVISCFPREDGAFRCEYQWFFAAGGQGADMVGSLRFAFEISGWTYNRLREIFTQD